MFQFFEKLVMDRGIKLTITTTLLEVPLPSTVRVSIHNNKTYEKFLMIQNRLPCCSLSKATELTIRENLRGFFPSFLFN